MSIYGKKMIENTLEVYVELKEKNINYNTLDLITDIEGAVLHLDDEQLEILALRFGLGLSILEITAYYKKPITDIYDKLDCAVYKLTTYIDTKKVEKYMPNKFIEANNFNDWLKAVKSRDYNIFSFSPDVLKDFLNSHFGYKQAEAVVDYEEDLTDEYKVFSESTIAGDIAYKYSLDEYTLTDSIKAEYYNDYLVDELTEEQRMAEFNKELNKLFGNVELDLDMMKFYNVSRFINNLLKVYDLTNYSYILNSVYDRLKVCKTCNKVFLDFTNSNLSYVCGGEYYVADKLCVNSCLLKYRNKVNKTLYHKKKQNQHN